MSRNVVEKSFLDDEETAEDNEIRRKDVRWSNPNGLQQGPDKSGSLRVGRFSSARHQDTSPGAEAVSEPGRRHPVLNKETRPGAVVVPGPFPDNEAVVEDGFTIWNGNEEQATIPPHAEPTLNVIARAVDTEEEERILREQDQLRRENDQLHQILENAPIVTPSEDPKCGPTGRRWFAIGAILLIAVVIAVTVALALVLPPEPTTPEDSLSELLSSNSSDIEELDFPSSALHGTIPTEIGEFTKLSKCYPDWCIDVHILILIILFSWRRSLSRSLGQ
jgi:hypothetical protein